MPQGKQESMTMPLEADNLQIALKLYERNPIAALLLAHQLMALKQCLERGWKGIPEAIAGLDLAIESLFSFTEFYKVSHKLYMRRLEGTLKQKEEERVRQLGVRL